MLSSNFLYSWDSANTTHLNEWDFQLQEFTSILKYSFPFTLLIGKIGLGNLQRLGSCYLLIVQIVTLWTLESGDMFKDSDVCDIWWPISHPSIEGETVLIKSAACPACEAATIPHTHHVRVVPLGSHKTNKKCKRSGACGVLLTPTPETCNESWKNP